MFKELFIVGKVTLMIFWILLTSIIFMFSITTPFCIVLKTREINTKPKATSFQHKEIC